MPSAPASVVSIAIPMIFIRSVWRCCCLRARCCAFTDQVVEFVQRGQVLVDPVLQFGACITVAATRASA